MADYATNLFFASTENERDLDKVEAFLDDNFADCFIERSEDMLDAQFSSLWVYPEKEIDKLVESLDAKDEIYIRILTYALKDEYVSFRTFSQGTWNIKFSSQCTGYVRIRRKERYYRLALFADESLQRLYGRYNRRRLW